MPPAMFLAMPLELSALPARLDAWLNLSQREKARVFVMDKIKARTVSNQPIHPHYQLLPPSQSFSLSPTAVLIEQTGMEQKREGNYLPTSVSQIGCSLTNGRIARANQNNGCTYNAIQKNLESGALIIFTAGSERSHTPCEAPDWGSTSFHQRRPTKRRPAMFFR